jgi:hypothetical protein
VTTALRTLGMALAPEVLDAALSAAEKDSLSHLEFLHRLLAGPAEAKRQRSLERRISAAQFRETNPENVPTVVEMSGGSSSHCYATSCLLPPLRSRTKDSRAFRRVGIARRPFSLRNLDSARSRPAAHQRFRMSPSRHRVTRAVTHRVTLNADSIGLVVDSVRRSAADTSNRTTVNVSSSPSRRLAAASGLIRLNHLAVLSSNCLAAS